MNLGFKLFFADKSEYVTMDSLIGETNGNTTVYKTTVNGARVTWTFEHISAGDIISLDVEGDVPLGITRIESVVFDVDSFSVTDRIPFFGTNADHTETRYPCELIEDTPYTNTATGLFPTLVSNGIGMALVPPFNNVAVTGAVRHKNSLTYLAKTLFTEDALSYTKLSAERVFYSENISIDGLFDVCQSLLPVSTFPMPKLVGWNSWDYYEQSITPDDIFENVDFLKNCSFKEHVKYIVIIMMRTWKSLI